MLTGLSYLMASIALAVLTLFMGAPKGERESDAGVFRYQAGWANAILGCAAIPIVLLALLFSLEWRRLDGIQMLVTAIVMAGLSCLCVYWHRYARDFSVKVDEEGLVINNVWHRTPIAFDKIAKVVLLQGGRGENVLTLFDKKDRKLLRLTSSIEDLDVLCDLVRVRAGKFGAIYKHRDMWGKWS